MSEQVRTFADEFQLGARSRALDQAPEFPWREFRAMGEAHFLGLHFPESVGGRGLPLPRVGTLLFHLAYLGGTTFAKLSLQPEFSQVLFDHGGPGMLEQHFRPLMRGERLIANQITEPDAGSDVAAAQMEARDLGEQYVLNGTKSEAAFASDAHAAIVYARVAGSASPEGITAFLVPQDLPGIKRKTIVDLGERWMRRGTITYRDVRLPKSGRIGEEGKGFRYVRNELRRERALLACIYLGVARASWDETVRYVGERAAFGRPLSDQEAVAFPLVEDGVELAAAWSYTHSVLEHLQSGEALDGEAAMAKWLATEVALKAIDHAIQFHGGRGYSTALPHEQRWRDVRSGKIAHGTSEIMHLVASRATWPPARPDRPPTPGT
ncbi:MAG: acyl-CoA dehydrogenase family protein [Thermoplasmata archaeon]